MDRTTLTRNLKPLEKQGLIVIAPGEDRRTRSIQLSASGHQILADALPLWRQAQQKITKQMGKKRLNHLIEELRALEKITSNLHVAGEGAVWQYPLEVILPLLMMAHYI